MLIDFKDRSDYGSEFNYEFDLTKYENELILECDLYEESIYSESSLPVIPNGYGLYKIEDIPYKYELCIHEPNQLEDESEGVLMYDLLKLIRKAYHDICNQFSLSDAKIYNYSYDFFMILPSWSSISKATPRIFEISLFIGKDGTISININRGNSIVFKMNLSES